MSIVLVTGSGGLIGSQTVAYYCEKGLDVVGIDCDARKQFFGDQASVQPIIDKLIQRYPSYQHRDIDIRDHPRVLALFKEYNTDINMIVHAAAQPSHDWAASQPLVDFAVNAVATSYLLDAYRTYCADASFVFTSTNKVYGDTPNRLPLLEADTRLVLPISHEYAHGINETMSIDSCIHSLFGVSKTAADLLVQEYGRNFGLKTGVFRAGCLTGESHRGARLHGFLSYLARACKSGMEYTVYGYDGKQVRDNLHAADVVSAIDTFAKQPRPGEVYNLGGGMERSVSVIEAIRQVEELSGKKMKIRFSSQARVGDHRWWITDTSKFRNDYPEWSPQVDLQHIFQSLLELDVAN
jgi:CDP-paratose 2-epimerase